MLFRPYRRGKPGLRTWNISPDELRQTSGWFTHPSDRLVLDLVDGGLYGRPTVSAFARGVAQLQGHPRVLIRRGRTARHARVLSRSISLRWRSDGRGGVDVVPLLDGEPARAATIEALVRRVGASGTVLTLDADEALVEIVRFPPGSRDVLEVMLRQGMRFEAAAAESLLSRASRLGTVLPLELDEELRGRALEPDERPLVRLTARDDGSLGVEVRLRPLPGAPAFTPGDGPAVLYATHGHERVHVERLVPAEERELVEEALLDLPELPGPDPWDHVVTDAELAFELIDDLREREHIFQLEWASDSLRITRAVGAEDLRLVATRRRDWLGIEGGVDVDGVEVALELLLRALREGRRFVRVEGNAWVRLSETLIERMAELAAASWEGRFGTELSPYAATSLDPLVESGARVERPPELLVQTQRLKVAQSSTPTLPPGLNAELRPYQLEGFRWIQRLTAWAPGACLADDMGLGKTVQALAVLLARAKGGPALVLAPTSVGFNWRREAERFAPSLRVLAYRDKGRKDLLEDLQPGTVLVTSYDIAHRDAEALAAVCFHTLVLDEAQAIKNPATRRARTVFGLDVAFTLALTGTPVENRTGELWSLFRAIVPGLLGSAERFRAGFSVPIERHGDIVRRAQLAALIRPFVLRRLKSQVATELPSRTDHVIEVELSTAERRLYEQARQAAIATLGAPGGPTARVRILAALTQLRQLACHPRLVLPDSRVASSKLARLLELIAEVRDGGHRTLVFSQFVRHLALVRDALEAEGVTVLELTGSTPAARRRELVDAFQRGEADVFLLSLKAGGTGLNLTAATYVVHLDPWWNPAVEDQATDRAHRIGQTAPVTTYRLVAQGTLEEQILELHAEKRELVAGLLAGTGSAAAMDAEALLGLLRG